MRQVIKEVFQYEELDERAKEKAREWYASSVFEDSHDWEYVIEDAVRVGNILGVDFDERSVRLMGGKTRGEPQIYFSGFWSQGDGACFEGSYCYAKGATKKVREYAPEDRDLHEIADKLQDIQRRNFYKLRAYCKQRGHYSHSGCMDVTVEHDDDRYRDIGDAEGDITQCLRDFADWIYRRLEDEYRYQCSDEVVEESIIANEYEFYEEGNRV